MGFQCFCSNYTRFSSQQLLDTDCNRPCLGNSKEMCGGHWRIMILSSFRTLENLISTTLKMAITNPFTNACAILNVIISLWRNMIFFNKVKTSYWRSENVVYSSISMFLFIGLLHWEGNIFDLVLFMILVKIILQTIHDIYSILWLTKILDPVITMCKLLILKYWLNFVQTKCIIDKKTM